MNPISQQEELYLASINKQYELFLNDYHTSHQKFAREFEEKYKNDENSLKLISAIKNLYTDVLINISGGTNPESIESANSIDRYAELEDHLLGILESAKKENKISEDIATYFGCSRKTLHSIY